MKNYKFEGIDEKIHDIYALWEKIDETDVKILEGLSQLGPRNLSLIAEHLCMPTTTLRYRVKRMLNDSLLYLHLNPYHTNMGLKKAVVFVEAVPGYEDFLMTCLGVNDFWTFLCRIYGPYEGCGGIWTIPKGNDRDFESFMKSLFDLGVARSYELNWTTSHEGVPVSSRWFSREEGRWVFNWDEWLREVEVIEGELPWTLKEPDDWPIRVDYEDLLIIKELEIDGMSKMTDISKKIGIPVERVKYHFREHISKRRLLEGYQMDIARFPISFSDYMFFNFEFDSYDKFNMFALSLYDKPFPNVMGKVLGENILVSHMSLPRREFRNFIEALSVLIKKGLLRTYNYVFQDIYQTWRETFPYEHFRDGGWDYDGEKHQKELRAILGKD